MATETTAQTDSYLQQRLQMVEQQIERRGVRRPSVVDAMKQRSAEFFVTRPSVVQHIGMHGLFSSGWSNSDFAVDFPGTIPSLLRLRLVIARLHHLVRRGLKRLNVHR